MLKTTIKNSILSLYALFKKNNSSKIFFYHDIHKNNRYTSMSTPLSLFKKHLEIINLEGYKIVSNIKNEKNEIMITFDDGWKGLYDTFDFFIEKKIPITIFLISSRIGKENYLSKYEIVEMLKTGLLSIGSHTVTHANLDELNNQQLYKELYESKSEIEELFGMQINSICYPRGRFNKKIILEAKKIGYRTQYSCLPGSYFNEPFKGIKRRNFVQHASPSEFKAWLYGGGEVFENRYRKLHIRATI